MIQTTHPAGPGLTGDKKIVFDLASDPKYRKPNGQIQWRLALRDHPEFEGALSYGKRSGTVKASHLLRDLKDAGAFTKTKRTYKPRKPNKNNANGHAMVVKNEMQQRLESIIAECRRCCPRCNDLERFLRAALMTDSAYSLPADSTGQ
jgi:hypothetical protein